MKKPYPKIDTEKIKDDKSFIFMTFGGEEKDGNQTDLEMIKYEPNQLARSHFSVSRDAFISHGPMENKKLYGIQSSFKNLEWFDVRLPCYSYQSSSDNQEIFEGKVKVKYFMVLQVNEL